MVAAVRGARYRPRLEMHDSTKIHNFESDVASLDSQERGFSKFA